MDDKQKVGIKSNSFYLLGLGLRRGRVILLIEGLAAKMALDA